MMQYKAEHRVIETVVRKRKRAAVAYGQWQIGLVVLCDINHGHACIEVVGHCLREMPGTGSDVNDAAMRFDEGGERGENGVDARLQATYDSVCNRTRNSLGVSIAMF